MARAQLEQGRGIVAILTNGEGVGAKMEQPPRCIEGRDEARDVADLPRWGRFALWFRPGDNDDAVATGVRDDRVQAHVRVVVVDGTERKTKGEGIDRQKQDDGFVTADDVTLVLVEDLEGARHDVVIGDRNVHTGHRERRAHGALSVLARLVLGGEGGHVRVGVVTPPHRRETGEQCERRKRADDGEHRLRRRWPVFATAGDRESTSQTSDASVGGDMSQEPTPISAEDTDVGSYEEIEREVLKHFGGSWETFFKALRNPADVLYFVLTDKYKKDKDAFEAWAKEKALPANWVPRFYGLLDENGEMKPREPAPEEARGPEEA